jgi:MFS family permease
MQCKQSGNKDKLLLIYVAIIYVVSEIVITLPGWILDTASIDLSLTVSQYIGKFYWTAIMYCVCAILICLLLAWFIRKTETKAIQKVLYYLILACILGCAWFPCNWDHSRLVTRIHDYFSYCLALFVAMSFAFMALFARNRQQKQYGICCVAYAAVFLAGFVLKYRPFKQTIFIWENILIFLFFFEVCMESTSAEKSNCK